MDLPATTTQEFKLEPAAIDWRTQKTQGTLVGPIVLVSLLAGVHFHAAAGAIALGALTAILVGLITSEITGRYGNRLGTAASVWAALVYCVLAAPSWTAPLSLESAAPPFYLLAMFGYMRYRSTREKWILRSGLAFAALGLFTSLVSTTLPLAVFAAEIIPHTDPTGSEKRRGNNWMAVALFFVVFFFVGSAGLLVPDMVPVLKHRMLPPFNIPNLQALAAPTIPAAAAAVVCLLGGLVTGGWTILVFCGAWMLLASSDAALAAAPLAIAVATLALPVTNSLPQRATTILTVIGMVALTAFAFLHVR